MRTMIIKALACVAASLLAMTTMAQTPTGQTSGTQPGKKGVARTVSLMATVTAVDKASRDVTLKGPQGNEITVTAGPDVKNFDAIKVGDGVNVSYKEALIVELKKGGGMVVGRSESQGAMKMNSGADSARHSRPPGYHRGGCHRRRPRDPDRDAEGAKAHRGYGRFGPAAVPAHCEGRPGRGIVHSGVCSGPRPSQKVGKRRRSARITPGTKLTASQAGSWARTSATAASS